ncbi:MAG: tail fiber protein [Terracidiphilus sp.]|jgi:microcystin-dependent protein
MSSPYLGQLSLVGFNFAPVGWQLAQGQTLPISQYTALFSLIGTYYGGNGTSNFQLPNLQGNVPVGYGQLTGGSFYDIGESTGSSTVTLLATETPNHTHQPSGKSSPAKVGDPATNNAFSDSSSGNIYTTSTSGLAQMSPSAISTYGGSQPHNNMMPYLGMYWIIAFSGIYPTRA